MALSWNLNFSVIWFVTISKYCIFFCRFIWVVIKQNFGNCAKNWVKLIVSNTKIWIQKCVSFAEFFGTNLMTYSNDVNLMRNSIETASQILITNPWKWPEFQKKNLPQKSVIKFVTLKINSTVQTVIIKMPYHYLYYKQKDLVIMYAFSKPDNAVTWLCNWVAFTVSSVFALEWFSFEQWSFDGRGSIMGRIRAMCGRSAGINILWIFEWIDWKEIFATIAGTTAFGERFELLSRQ